MFSHCPVASCVKFKGSIQSFQLLIFSCNDHTTPKRNKIIFECLNHELRTVWNTGLCFIRWQLDIPASCSRDTCFQSQYSCYLLLVIFSWYVMHQVNCIMPIIYNLNYIWRELNVVEELVFGAVKTWRIYRCLT